MKTIAGQNRKKYDYYLIELSIVYILLKSSPSIATTTPNYKVFTPTPLSYRETLSWWVGETGLPLVANKYFILIWFDNYILQIEIFFYFLNIFFHRHKNQRKLIEIPILDLLFNCVSYIFEKNFFYIISFKFVLWLQNSEKFVWLLGLWFKGLVTVWGCIKS